MEKAVDRAELQHGDDETVKALLQDAQLEEYNEKCDIWSTGVTLYLMFWGKYPYDLESVQTGSVLKTICCCCCGCIPGCQSVDDSDTLVVTRFSEAVNGPNEVVIPG